MDDTLLVDLQGAPACATVRVCLQLKEIPYRRAPMALDLRTGRPDAASGGVPTLCIGERRIAGEWPIVAHLETMRPTPALVPEGDAAWAYCRMVSEWSDRVLGHMIAAHLWQNPMAARETARTLAIEMAPRPLAPLVARWLRRQAWQRYGLPLANLEEQLTGAVRVLAASLGERPFLLGATLTAADVAAHTRLARLGDTDRGDLVRAHPTVESWYARLSEIDAVRAALAP